MDPLTLAGVGGVALTEGIKFLYGQAADLLREWRSRGDEAAASTAEVRAELPDAVGGGVLEAEVDLERVGAHSDRLTRLCGDVGNYANGIATITDEDRRIFELTAELRDTLEEVLGQHITFNGEQRMATGTPIVSGRVTAETVEGTADGVAAETISGETHVVGSVDVGTVAEHGSVAGVRAKRIGGSSVPEEPADPSHGA